VVVGGDGEDRIAVGAQTGWLRGGAGDDVITGTQTLEPAGPWAIDGGAGDDRLIGCADEPSTRGLTPA
jgi:Ca2+-binding RTX toxin-like protein